MGIYRFFPAAVKLADERRVLVMGGGERNTTEYLDLETNTFSPGPPMTEVRDYAAAVQIDEGRIGVFGGWDAHGRPLKTSEILDIQKGAFSVGPAMDAERGDLMAAAV